MRNAVTEISIENPIAKEAFIRWWRSMEAQGYQYGFEALCNVWVGFDDGRIDLARKVLAAVSDERLTENLDNDGGPDFCPHIGNPVIDGCYFCGRAIPKPR